MRNWLLASMAWLLAWSLCGAMTLGATSDGQGEDGLLGSASKHWRLPDTPNGLHPTESWHATASSPNGDIFVGGMDHATNSALYAIDAATGRLRYLGDARSASEAIGNWLPDETAQKFHTRPLSFGDKVYVATLDRSTLNDEYLSRRGFHWYAYSLSTREFVDLSASEPGGAAAKHGGLVALAADPPRRVIYGASVPTGEIYRYDIDRGQTENLGRPATFDKRYLYIGRVMWVDSRGRLYFTAGDPGTGSYDPGIYGHVFYYDASRGFGEMKGWTLREPHALELGQCSLDRKRCFFSDALGEVYRFDDDGPVWTYIGRIDIPQHLWTWVFDVSPDQRKAYIVTSSRREDHAPSSLYEFDLTNGHTRTLCGLAQLNHDLGESKAHTGYDAWDNTGGFYFASFAGASDRSVMVTRVDPVRLKQVLGLLPDAAE